MVLHYNYKTFCYNEIMKHIIAERISEIRKENGLSQPQFGRRIFVSQQAVYAWEKGRNVPNAECIIAIAQEFNISSDFILGLKEF